MGTAETLQNDIKIANDAAQATGAQRTNLVAGESALQALQLAKGYTGPGTGTTARMWAFLQANDPTGAVPQGTMSDTAWRQVLAKNLLRFAQSSGMRGNTDLGLQTSIEGNANADQMLAAANEHVLVQDIGLARQRLAQTLDMPAPSVGGAVANHVKTFTSTTDPRGFAWQYYSPTEQNQILAEAAAADKASGKSPNDKTSADYKLHKAIGIATRLGMNNPIAVQPPAPSVAPPAAAPGPRAMTQPNALAPPASYAGATPNALAA